MFFRLPGGFVLPLGALRLCVGFPDLQLEAGKRQQPRKLSARPPHQFRAGIYLARRSQRRIPKVSTQENIQHAAELRQTTRHLRAETKQLKQQLRDSRAKSRTISKRLNPFLKP